MTGYLSGSKQPLSPITLAGLEDLGYDVDYDLAAPFSSSDIADECRCDRRSLRTGDNVKALANTEGEHPSRRRRLSAEGEQKAIDFGTAILQMRKASDSRVFPEGETNTGESSISDIGNKVLIVLYEEDGQYYSVNVHADS